ncbi:MAG: lysylphosphatidylglycerol synthase domain-containing protein [Nevskia sp.]|uniref:lysylphosphatidylglycerol synthase domain-containing protein n=1 Tax=Nevskia sp. TaxID=1929292 RepID=UPI00403616BB
MNLGVVAAFGYAVEHFWGWGRLLAPWAQIAPSTLALAIAGMLASYALRGSRIYLAEPQIPRGAWFTCLRLILVNNALNLLLPARAGEVSFPVLMRRWFGIDLAQAAGTLFWLRLLDLHVLATVAAACAASGLLSQISGLSALAWLGAAAAAFSPLLLFTLRAPLQRRFAARSGTLAGLIAKALAGLPTRPATLALDLLLTWAAWGVKLAALGIVLGLLAQVSPLAGTLGAIGGDLSTVLPLHAPGGFGTYEAGAMALLLPASGQTDLGPLLAAAVNLHLLVLTTALIAGALAWLATPRR